MIYDCSVGVRFHPRLTILQSLKKCVRSIPIAQTFVIHILYTEMELLRRIKRGKKTHSESAMLLLKSDARSWVHSVDGITWREIAWWIRNLCQYMRDATRIITKHVKLLGLPINLSPFFSFLKKRVSDFSHFQHDFFYYFVQFLKGLNNYLWIGKDKKVFFENFSE